MKFIGGDRVVVYGRHDMKNKLPMVFKGIVQQVLEGEVGVEPEAEQYRGLTIYCHPKQLRKLVKRERRRVWVGLRRHHLPGGDLDQFYEARFAKPGAIEGTADGAPWIEFIEVRRPKR